jgi:hypothetical protein
MRKALIAIASVVMTASASYAQVLVAGWDFQTTTTGGTATAAAPATPKIYTAILGLGDYILMEVTDLQTGLFQQVAQRTRN